MKLYKIQITSKSGTNTYSTKAISDEKAISNVLYNLYKTDYKSRNEAEVKILSITPLIFPTNPKPYETVTSTNTINTSSNYSDKDLKNIRVSNLIQKINNQLTKSKSLKNLEKLETKETKNKKKENPNQQKFNFS